MAAEQEYMTTAEVAELLRVPVETVRFWRAKTVNKGPRHFKLPGSRRVLYARSDVEAWLAIARNTSAA